MAESAHLIRSGYERFAEGDVPGVLALFDEGISWHIGGQVPGVSRRRRKVDEFWN